MDYPNTMAHALSCIRNGVGLLVAFYPATQGIHETNWEHNLSCHFSNVGDYIVDAIGAAESQIGNAKDSVQQLEFPLNT